MTDLTVKRTGAYEDEGPSIIVYDGDRKVLESWPEGPYNDPSEWYVEWEISTCGHTLREQAAALLALDAELRKWINECPDGSFFLSPEHRRRWQESQGIFAAEEPADV